MDEPNATATATEPNAAPAAEPPVSDSRTINEVPRFSEATLEALPPALRHNVETVLASAQRALDVQRPDVLRRFVEDKVAAWRQSLGREFVSSREASEAQAHFSHEAERISGQQLVEAEAAIGEVITGIENAIKAAEQPPSLLANLAPSGDMRARQLAAHSAIAQRVEAFVANARTSASVLAFYRHLLATGEAEAAGHLERLAEAGLLPKGAATAEDIEAGRRLDNVLRLARAARVPEELRTAGAVLDVARQRLSTWRGALAASKASTAIAR